MLPDRVSNPGPLTYESGALSIALCGPAADCKFTFTVKTLNIGTPRPATVVVLNIKQFNFTMK